MYEDYLETVLIYIRALNAAEAEIIPKIKDGLTPNLGRIPVVLDGCLSGYLADEVGGSWSLQDATAEEVHAFQEHG